MLNRDRVCLSCGRDFSGDDGIEAGQLCPADDCPSHDEGDGEWSGSPCPADPDNFWIDDKTGERIPA